MNEHPLHGLSQQVLRSRIIQIAPVTTKITAYYGAARSNSTIVCFGLMNVGLVGIDDKGDVHCPGLAGCISLSMG
jgi:hypothetical protein